MVCRDKCVWVQGVGVCVCYSAKIHCWRVNDVRVEGEESNMAVFV